MGGGGYIHIFVFCPTNFFWNELKKLISREIRFLSSVEGGKSLATTGVEGRKSGVAKESRVVKSSRRSYTKGRGSYFLIKYFWICGVLSKNSRVKRSCKSTNK